MIDPMSVDNYRGRDTGYMPSPGVINPGQNAMLTSIGRTQMKNAENYAQGMGDTYKQGVANLTSQSVQNLAQKMRDVKSSQNARGLLRSGQTTSKMAGAAAQENQALAGNAMNLKNQLNDNYNKLVQGGLGSLYSVAGSNPNLGQLSLNSAQNAINNSIAQQQMQQQMYSSFGQAGGMIAGGLMG